MSMNVSDIAILKPKNADYRCIISHKIIAKYWFDWKK